MEELGQHGALRLIFRVMNRRTEEVEDKVAQNREMRRSHRQATH